MAGLLSIWSSVAASLRSSPSGQLPFAVPVLLSALKRVGVAVDFAVDPVNKLGLSFRGNLSLIPTGSIPNRKKTAPPLPDESLTSQVYIIRLSGLPLLR